MEIMNGGPAARRRFIDHFLLLYDDTYIEHLHRLNTLVAQRTALLQKFGACDHEQLKHWTQLLWQESIIIAQKRTNTLVRLMQYTSHTLQEIVQDFVIQAQYMSRVKDEPFDAFWDTLMKSGLCAQEQRQRRTLFGAHLDDIFFTLNNKSVRLFASRGQQKLILIALMCARAQLLVDELNITPALFFDDILLDLDSQKLGRALEVVQTLDCQFFISCAQQHDELKTYFSPENLQSLFLG
jgi:DNA replication and repair protein RecF